MTAVGAFQMFPALDADTDAALRASIERWGVLVPVAKDQHGRILDGHHRDRIARELGIDYPVDTHEVGSDEHARALAATLNADRRQLPPDVRRRVVAQLRDDGHSTRAIAEAVGVDQSTVVRDDHTQADTDAPASVSAPEVVQGRDGKTHPAKKTALTGREIAARGLELAAQGMNRAEIAAELGVAECSYRRVRDIALMAEQDPDTYGDLLEAMDKPGQIKPCWYEMYRRREGIQRPPQPSTKRVREAFAEVIRKYESYGDIVTGVEIPSDLTAEQRADAVARLKAGRAGLSKFINAIEKEGTSL